MQVQQILLDSNRREPAGLHPVTTQPGVPPRLVMDTLGTTSSYYYGNPTYHQTPPGSAGASMDDLVAMWFSGGPSTSGKPFTVCLYPGRVLAFVSSAIYKKLPYSTGWTCVRYVNALLFRVF